MKKYIIIFGAVAIALLMISTVTAVDTPGSSITKNCSVVCNEEVFIDPDIFLTTDDLPTLYATLPYINDEDFDYIQILQDIIDLIEDKGFIDSSDMQGIIEDSGAEITAVYGPSTIATTSKTDGWANTVPGMLRLGLLPRFGFWARYDYIPSINQYGWHLNIKGSPVSKGDGRAVGFFGFLRAQFDPHMSGYFEINGVCILVFHSVSSVNLQSRSHPVSQPSSQPSTPNSSPTNN